MTAAALLSPAAGVRRLRIRVRGAVQGVGFRPHVHALASRCGLSGFVLNDAEGVLVEVEGGDPHALVAALARDRPPLARIDAVEAEEITPSGGEGFVIAASRAGAAATRIPPDAAACARCIAEVFDPASRFFGYPFTSCTHCGPRFTLTRQVPFDRANTAMAPFPLCASCDADHRDSAGRRFHHQAIACPACGPKLSHPVADVAAAIAAGAIVALKGVGGFHLLCDARNADAVDRLRARKHRDAKPFAVMAANARSVPRIAAPTPLELRLLAGAAAPIVLVTSRPGLAAAIAPGLSTLGLMLACAPVHHLLFAALAPDVAGAFPDRIIDAALVATSGNVSGEPLVIDDAQARERLAGVADLIVGHDRAILARADDSVMRVIDGAPVFLRRARGFVPDPVPLAEDGPPVIAFGGHLKATVTVTRGREAFVSRHTGDLATAAAVRAHAATAHELLDYLGVTAQAAACDLHPDFASTRLAEETGLPVHRIQHHAAHIAAVAAEHGVTEPLPGVALDGYGYGDDGGAWGGELLLLEGRSCARLGHLAPIPLPGGDRAARQPWRIAAGLLHGLGREAEARRRFGDHPSAAALIASFDARRPEWTTSLGRLFDAAAALLGVCTVSRHEGEAAMLLEALADDPREMDGGYLLDNGVLSFTPLMARLAAGDLSRAEGANLFHGAVAAGLAAWIAAAARPRSLDRVALAGGCIANRALTEGLAAQLRGLGLAPLVPALVPPGDGGLSLGQALLARRIQSSV